MKTIIIATGLFLCCGVSAVAETGAAVGLVGFGALGGQVHWQPENSRWRLGLQYGRVPDYTFRDPFTGRPLSLEQEEFLGAFVHRQFRPGRDGRWYAAAALLRWWRREKSLLFGGSDSDASLAPYLGGGYMRRFGERWFWNLGILVSPWAENNVKTEGGSTENDGAADLHANIGILF